MGMANANGQAASNDSYTITYSEAIDASTLMLHVVGHDGNPHGNGTVTARIATTAQTTSCR